MAESERSIGSGYTQFFCSFEGFDHRIGHFRLPDMVDRIHKPPMLQGLRSCYWDVVC
jgi:hypothetical protein